MENFLRPYNNQVSSHPPSNVIIFASSKIYLFVSIIFSRGGKKFLAWTLSRCEKTSRFEKETEKFYAKLDKTWWQCGRRKGQAIRFRVIPETISSFDWNERQTINPLIEATTIRWKFRLNREYLKANNRTHMCVQAWLDSSRNRFCLTRGTCYRGLFHGNPVLG